jgi:hypothetical protein
MHPRLASLTGVALASLVTVAPVRAEAQFGGLRKKLEQQVQKTVLGGDDQQAAAAPAFSDRVLEITDARLGQVVAGLKAEAALAERDAKGQAEVDARYKAWEARSEAYGKCAEPFKSELLKGTGRMMVLAVAVKREEAKNGAASPALRDSVAVVTNRMKATSETLKAKCGESPGDAPADLAGDGDDAPSPESVGAKAAGLRVEQYAVLRERVVAWLHARNGNSGRYAFAAGERAALEARAGELGAFRKLLTG